MDTRRGPIRRLAVSTEREENRVLILPCRKPFPKGVSVSMTGVGASIAWGRSEVLKDFYMVLSAEPQSDRPVGEWPYKINRLIPVGKGDWRAEDEARRIAQQLGGEYHTWPKNKDR